MEDAATAEICRAQLWQWLRYEAPLDDGRHFTRDLLEEWLAAELAMIGEIPNLRPAAQLIYDLVTAETFEEFLTLPAYERLKS
jgi:malate synthase